MPFFCIQHRELRNIKVEIWTHLIQDARQVVRQEKNMAKSIPTPQTPPQNHKRIVFLKTSSGF